MPAKARLTGFPRSEEGGILVFWSMTLVVLLGLAAVVVDAGRLASTQSELQSYADSVSLAAASELDGRADALSRARAAAANLIEDSQTFGAGDAALSADQVSLTFYRSQDARFDRATAQVTTDPFRARFVEAQVADRRVALPFAAAMAALGTNASVDDAVGATAVASFGVEACDVAPIAVCLPSVDFSAEAAIGSSLSLETNVSASVLLPGSAMALAPVTDLLDDLRVCAGLSGGALNACLLAAQQPATQCGGAGGFEIAAQIDGTGLLDAVNTRFGQFDRLVSGLANNPDFPVAPGLLDGVLGADGLCLPNPDARDIALPTDDCMASGACAIQGDGAWSLGRDAYVEAHYDGTDPFPQASTRFEFYQAEVAAGVGPEASSDGLGGLLGTVTETLLPQLCVPPTPANTSRRLMVVAGIDCAEARAGATLPPVREFFEVFLLGPGENGLLDVEITACLGGGCGTGTLDTDVRDIVRLVE